MLEHALKYRKLGFSIIPISKSDKRPLINWKDYQTKKPTEAEIRKWWERWPEGNIGIVCGKVSDLLVIDTDPRNGSNESLQGKNFGLCPVAKTGGGGHHYYFKYDARAKKKVGVLPGVDIQADGSYVVAPPSITKGKYEWLPSRSIDEVPPPGIYEWIAEFFTKPSENEYVGDSEGTLIPAGKRHNFLVSRAGSLKRRGYNQDIILEALKHDYAKYCEKAENEDMVPELSAIAKSMEGYKEEEHEETGVITIGDNEADLDKYVTSLTERKRKIIPFPTGFNEIDKKTEVIRRGKLHTIAARTNVGKTSFALNLVRTLIQCDKSVLFLSTEMTKNEIYDRYVSIGSRISGDSFISGEFTEEDKKKLERETRSLKRAKLFISDAFEPTLESVIACAEQIRPDVVVFDYLQHIPCKRGDMRLTISEFVREMKKFAVEKNMCVILVSQLSRPQRMMRFSDAVQIFAKPALQDLKESGSIEEESDFVTLISTSGENMDEGVPVMDIAIAKNKFGPTLEFQLGFDKMCSRFFSLED